jgi:hypothetical protein
MNRIRARIDLIAGFEIWKRGVPLCDADWHYAPAHLRRDYNAIRVPKPLPVTETAAVNPPESSGWETFALATRYVAEHALSPLSERWSVRGKMRDRLFRSHKSGELRAYGFHVPRKPSDVPVRLPIDVFEFRFVNWEESSVKGAGLEFASVRVIRGSEAQEIESRHPADAIYPALGPKGRPTMRIHISQAINSMYAERLLPNDKSRRANANELRRRVQNLLPTADNSEVGLGESTLCKALKAAEDVRREIQRDRK